MMDEAWKLALTNNWDVLKGSIEENAHITNQINEVDSTIVLILSLF